MIPAAPSDTRTPLEPPAANAAREVDDGACRAAGLPGGCRGNLKVDVRAILALALPLFLNSSIQAVLNLTDTWFIGRISSTAVAAMAAVHWLTLGFLLLFGGVAMGVQTFAAQAYGARALSPRGRCGLERRLGFAAGAAGLPPARRRRVRRCWSGSGSNREVAALAVEFWQPRMAGGVLALLLWAPMSYFYGTGQVRTAVLVNLAVAVANAVLDEILMFRLGWGIAGAAWATNGALAIGFLLSLFVFTRLPLGRRRFAGHLLWRPRRRADRGDCSPWDCRSAR